LIISARFDSLLSSRSNVRKRKRVSFSGREWHESDAEHGPQEAFEAWWRQMRQLKNTLAGVMSAMRKSIHSKSGTSTRPTLTSAQSTASARSSLFVRYVGLALYMVDPVHGVCDPELVSEYASSPAPKCELPRRRSPGYWLSLFIKAKTRKAEEGTWK
jgi:hypothetical protein